MLARDSGKIVNNASISGYAYFPAATTYAASKAGVVAFTESLRRELTGTGVTTLHLVTPGVDTDMLDATEDVYGKHLDTSDWEKQEPAEWAAKVVNAIRDDSTILGPGGKTAIAKLASRGPGFLMDRISDRMFSREPRPRRAYDSARAAAVLGLGQHHLHVADPALAEARLHVGQVQLPHAPETPVVAQLLGQLRRWPRTSRASGAASPP